MVNLASGERPRPLVTFITLCDALAACRKTVFIHTLEQKGYRVRGESRSLWLNGEMDVALPVESPDEERLWALVEVKTRARLKDLEKWNNQLAIDLPYLPYLFGLRVYARVDEAAEAAGADPLGL